MGSSPDSSPTGDRLDAAVIFLLVGTLFSLGRMGIDVFILTVNCRDWMKKKHLSPVDRILTLQGSIRICLSCMTIIRYILAKVQLGYILKVLRFGFWYFTSCNVWLTASLCSYYCVKIADFSHPFFIHLKQRLSSGLGSTWFLGPAILAVGSSLPFVFSDLQIRNGNFSNFFQNKNVTHSYTVLPLHSQALLGLGYFAAFSICATSAILLLFSLWRHRQRMLDSWEGHRSPQLDAHFQAVTTILSLLLIHIVIFVSIEVLLSKNMVGNLILYHGTIFVLYICFLVESLVSVWGNKKLKNELRRCLYLAKCKGYAS